MRGVERVDFRARQRLVIQPALKLIRARNANHVGLGVRFDPFGGDAHLHRARHCDAGMHHRAAAIIFFRLNNETAVELELLKAELTQKADRGVAGPEIVDRHIDPNVALYRLLLDSHIGFTNKSPLRNFNFLSFWIQF